MPRRKRKNNLTPKMRTRFTIMWSFIILVAAILFARILYLAVNTNEESAMAVLGQQDFKNQKVPYKRGDILDRNGYTLATSVKVYNLILDTKVMLADESYLEPTIKTLVHCFDFSESDLRSIIDENPNNTYIVAQKKMEYELVKNYKEYVETLDKEEKACIKGVWFESEYERRYPYSALACKVIGFTNDGDDAQEGIEGYYNDYLCGINGRQYGYINEDSDVESVVSAATDGAQVTSTIDMEIQSIVEEKIAEYMEEVNPKRIGVVIMNPNNGEILAMADDISYDLNSPRDLSPFCSKKELKSMSDEEKYDKLQKVWRNFCVADSYEPGSTMKPFTVAAALEEGIVSKDDTYYCDGGEEVAGRTIHCSGTHDTLDLTGAIVNSCNDALMQIGFKLGATALSNYQTGFGFGVRTGIDLSGETPGLVYDGDSMDSATIATNSFGQNFTVNAIQIISGFSSLVNGGYYYQPHVVKEIKDSDGNILENYSKILMKQTVTTETSEFIKQALRETVLAGTGYRAEIKGYRVGGKTGTAEKSENGKKLKDEYVLSFIGAVPIENPEVVCYVIIDTPEEEPDNSAYATKFFNRIMSEVLPYMNIEKTEPDDEWERAKKDTSSTDEVAADQEGDTSDLPIDTDGVDSEGDVYSDDSYSDDSYSDDSYSDDSYNDDSYVDDGSADDYYSDDYSADNYSDDGSADY